MESWFQELIGRIPEPLFLLNLDTQKVSYSNESARLMLGLQYEDEWRRERHADQVQLFYADGRPTAPENRPSVRAMKGETIPGEDYRLIVPGGDFLIRVFVAQIPAMHGQPRSAMILFQDISQLKKTEGELRTAQNRLTEAIEIAQVGFWQVELPSMKLTLTDLYRRQHGLAEGATRETALARIDPRDRDKVQAAVAATVERGAIFHIEYRVGDHDPFPTWIEAKGERTLGMDGTVLKFAGTTVDISARKRIEEDLKTSQAVITNERYQLDQIFHQSPAAMATWLGDNLVFDRVNPRYAEIFRGRTLLGRPLLEACPELKGQGFDTLVKEVMRTGEPFTGKEVRALISPEPGAPPEERYYNFSYIALRDANGKSYGVYDHAVDVTETVISRQEVESARQAAETANHAKSQFLANMSHEIRTPLGAIMGFASLLQDPKLSQEDRDQYAAVIERNSAQLSRIIDDILDLTKVEAGMIAIERIDFSLTRLLNEFTSTMDLQARERGIVFSARAATPLPSDINCDPTRLRQILTNIVSNAVKFTERGSVELSCRYHAPDLIFEVRDTGRGITPEQAAKLFQPFSQGDPSITRKYGGTGLGLVLTRNLASALGGVFSLKHSVPGEGSVFEARIKAPAARGARMVDRFDFESEKPRPTSTSGELAGLRVLLVEDSPDNQTLITIYLSRAGARIDLASNGLEGVTKAMGQRPDIILMDLQMPEMDGLTAVRTLRAKGHRGPIIALTAHAMKTERDRCLEAGFDDFLSKPVARNELIAVIDKNRKKNQ